MIAITAATGSLGRLVMDELLGRGVPAAELVAVVRSPDKAADLAARGIAVRAGDYDSPEQLAIAFLGVDKVLLISGTDIGRRPEQHGNVIAAAGAAGVGSIAYTSILKADTSTVTLATEHLATERALAASGVPHTLLRNGWYHENYDSSVATAVEHGLVGATGGGAFNAAARADYAAAAAAVLTGEGHDGKVYELGGEAITLDAVAAAITEATGTTVVATDVPAEAYGEILAGAGLPAPIVEMLVSADVGIARGDLATDSDDLARLVGRPLRPLGDAIRAAVAVG